MSHVSISELVKPFTSDQKRWLSGKERNQVRAALRKALKAGKLEHRTLYYDHYDSCQAPTKTPNAPWQVILSTNDYEQQYWLERLKSGPYTPSVVLLPDGTYELVTSYSTCNVRIVKGD